MQTSAKLALITGLALLSTPSIANAAVTVSSTSFGLNDTPAGATVIDFETPLPSGFNLTGGSIRNYTDAAGAEPAASNNAKETSFYLAANANDPATITASCGYTSVSLYWGSIDDYNTLTLLDQNGGIIQAFTGMQVGPPANGDQGSAATNRRVTFNVDGATSPIYGLRFQSDSPAFEVDNIAFSGAVPEPASWAMMIIGFGVVGAARRRGTSLGVA